MKKNIYLIYGNHFSYLGVKHIYDLLINDFKNYNFIASKNIKKNQINILCENFYSRNLVDDIKKKNNKTKLICIYTEFINHNINTYNSFEIDKKYLSSIPYYFISTVYYILSSIFYFRKYLFRYLIKFYVIGFFSRIFYFFFDKKKKKRKKKKIQSAISAKFYYYYNREIKFFYWKERFDQSLKLAKYFDAIICTHPKIKKDLKKKLNFKNIFLHMPKVKNSAFKRKINNDKFKFSGDYNEYRKLFFEKSKRYFNNKDDFYLNFLSLLPKKTTFIDIPKNIKYRFSFHPGKSNRWHFSSPTRLVSALNNCELPIVFNRYNDVSRYLCIYIKKLNKNNINYLIKYKKKLIKKIFTNINKYNSRIYFENNKINKLFSDL